MVKIEDLTRYMDNELDSSNFSDLSNNGLQVGDSEREIDKICFGVDASIEFFEEAIQRRAGMVVCHHGLSWGDSLKRITGLNYSKIRFLVNNNLALYACHLPLDAHPRCGNNAQICKALGLKKVKAFGFYKDRQIGFRGEFTKKVSLAAFKKKVKQKIGRRLECMDFGSDQVKSVGVVSGSAADGIEEAAQHNLDVYLSGEPSLVGYNLARECGINAVFAGHYATEIFGVRALAGIVSERFRVSVDTVDLKIPY